MQINSEPETETIELRDIDVIFGLGETYPLTLEQADRIELPDPLGSGDISVMFANGEHVRINGTLVKWVSQRTRTVTRKVKKNEPTQ